MSGFLLISVPESEPKETPMANREQKSSREKKKPKADKKAAPISASAKPTFQEPQLIRKPHKGKDWG